jgi:hypothetical protein
MSVVGDRLFVNAPARMHPQIRWIIDQLPWGGAPRSDAAPTRPNTAAFVQVYPLKYAAAEEVIPVLRTMLTIRSIDFAKVTADARTNSITCSATPFELALLGAALESLDRPAKGPRTELIAPAPAEVVYLVGPVPRPGTYALTGDLTVRRLLAAAGGLPESAKSVVLTDSKDGQATVMQELDAEELRRVDGADPVLKRGAMVSVR